MESNEIIECCARALFGDDGWANKTAALLGVSTRSFRRWMNGTVDVPQGVWVDLSKALAVREEKIRQALRTIEVEEVCHDSY